MNLNLVQRMQILIDDYDNNPEKYDVEIINLYKVVKNQFF
jgi:hypothetical protein